MIIKKEVDLNYVRFKLEHTYSCYLCRWVGDDNEVALMYREDISYKVFLALMNREF